MKEPETNTVENLPEDLAELLERLAEGLRGLYGERYRGLVLYGSYARGDADEGSDVDLLLLLEGKVDSAEEITAAESVKWLPALYAGYAVSIIPVSAKDYQNPREPVLMNAHREGMLLS
ncbi:MAG: nucleotidyltransferase domain-containing protein [Rubrobacter sp.]|jgi:predicted nucleotidyltransferase|nr:nucleotidyltransferase domain-containing protein [Rubrobacter sp.]